MPAPSSLQLSRRERQIMDIVFARGAATAAEVGAALPDPPARALVVVPRERATLMTGALRKFPVAGLPLGDE